MEEQRCTVERDLLHYKTSSSAMNDGMKKIAEEQRLTAVNWEMNEL